MKSLRFPHILVLLGLTTDSLRSTSFLAAVLLLFFVGQTSAAPIWVRCSPAGGGEPVQFDLMFDEETKAVTIVEYYSTGTRNSSSTNDTEIDAIKVHAGFTSHPNFRNDVSLNRTTGNFQYVRYWRMWGRGPDQLQYRMTGSCDRSERPPSRF